MAPMLQLIRTAASTRWVRWFVLPAAALAVVGVVLSASTPPAIPAVTLSAEPLYAKGARAKPTLTLDLSVEFPTVGAQYLGLTSSVFDNTYSGATTYPGYFDTESCYSYNNAPTEAIPTGATLSDYKRFDRLMAAATPATDANPRSCGGAGFSGNFMNWASSSAIDILRYGLTGGDRVIDTAALTVLQRAVLPNINVATKFWNDKNFPDKQLTNAQAAAALPSALLGTYTGTVHVANCLNRIHFGTQATGSCASPGNNSNLGVPPNSGNGTVTQGTAPYPPSGGFTSCAIEGAVCAFTGIQQVAFGTDTRWRYVSALNGVTCSTALFGDPAPGSYKSCYIRNDPTGWTPTGAYGTTTLASDGFFYTRASVCASSGSTLTDPRTSLCLKYPNGSYKPVGNMQKSSDQVRVSVFGYLNDATPNPAQRYGGVLRVPMKYVGPTSYDTNFKLISGTNANREWDPATGIFIANPDGNTTVGSGPNYTGPYLSGAINYLNQFGRTGIFGQYKTNDPVSELYYESLRYIQGLQPTPAATSGLSSGGSAASILKDGFPVTTTWTDPHPAVAGSTDYSCVKNNIFTIGDIHTHNDATIPGNVNQMLAYNNATLSNSPRPAATTGPGPYADNQPDFYYWMKVVGGFESGNAVQYTDGGTITPPVAPNANRYTNNPINSPVLTGAWGIENYSPNGDGSSYFIMGMAYWANTHDIRSTSWTGTGAAPRPGMRATTYMLDVNENGQSTDPTAQHKNQYYLAAKYGGFNDQAANGNPFVYKNGTIDNSEWAGTPTGTQATNYFLSSSAQSVLDALDAIFHKVTEQSNSIAGGTSTTQQLSSATSYVFQAQFDPASWSGDLNAYKVVVDPNSGAVVVGNSATDKTAAWQASVALAAKAAATVVDGDARNIVVGNSVRTSSTTAMNFVWNSLDTTTKTALLTPPYAGTGAPLDSTATGQARLTYLRGDRSNEAVAPYLFRTRGTLIGDIVNSGVTFSGAPTKSISDSSYTSFYSTYLNRTHALFVGANDGMLHAFDPDHGDGTASGGDELFAYIPSWVVPRLANLTSTSYVHQSYVDATPVVAEAQVGSNWKTVLVGGTGAGGQGVFALDVTDPAAFNASKVMWEFTDADDPDMGNVIGKAQILKLKTDNSATGNPKYFAVVASGVNNYVNDSNFSTTGRPAIFLLDLSKPAGTSWTLGTNYFKISIWQQSTFATVSATMASGIVSFASVLGTDGTVTALYTGDLHGNVWKIDFTKATAGTSNWSLATLSGYANSGGPMPMYVAKDASGNRQPITIAPALAYGANQGIIVAFGTGKFLENGDLSSTSQQSVYAIYDDGTSTADSAAPTSAITGRVRLAQGATSITTSAGKVTGVTVNVPNFVWGRSLQNTDTVRSGWYFDFATTGERQISDFNVEGGSIQASSVIPPASSCDDGSGFTYSIDVASGDGSGQASTVGILGAPLVLQIGDASQTANGTTGMRSKTVTLGPIVFGTGGLVPAPSNPTVTYSGRMSWRNITNYQCIKNSTSGVCQQ